MHTSISQVVLVTTGDMIKVYVALSRIAIPLEHRTDRFAQFCAAAFVDRASIRLYPFKTRQLVGFLQFRPFSASEISLLHNILDGNFFILPHVRQDCTSTDRLPKLLRITNLKCACIDESYFAAALRSGCFSIWAAKSLRILLQKCKTEAKVQTSLLCLHLNKVLCRLSS